MNVPIISLEVQHMRYAIKTALTEHAAMIDSSIQKAVDEYCTEANIGNIVAAEARRQIDATLKEEVQRFFAWDGAGRKAVREAVVQHLEELYPSTDKEKTL